MYTCSITNHHYPLLIAGITHPSHPNFFILHGPGTGLGHNSVIFMIECQVLKHSGATNPNSQPTYAHIQATNPPIQATYSYSGNRPTYSGLILIPTYSLLNIQATYSAEAIATIMETGARAVTLKKEVRFKMRLQSQLYQL